MFNERDVWTLFHSCAFDFSVWELWGALVYGGKLVIVPFGVSRTPEAFHRLLREQAVTVLNQTPSAFRQLMRADEAAGAPALALRYVIFGGEALDPKMLKPWFERHGDQRPRLVNMYGITETTVHVTYRPLSTADLDTAGSVIGLPIPDLQIHLLDETQAPVAAGEPGEIYVGGAGVARGYLKRPELTAERFVKDPFASTPGQRLYKSGDLGRFLPDGDLEYLGRIDAQVKLRGFRIELGEIAAALNLHPGVRDSVVIVVDDAAGEKALAAYIVMQPVVRESTGVPEPAAVPGPAAVPAPAAVLDPAAVRATLRKRLPEYMIPTYIEVIDALPLTVNGKLDVKALPPPRRSAGSTPLGPSREVPGRVVPAQSRVARGRAGPERESTPLESQIAAIWSDVLQIDRVGMNQNFFDVGGNSVHIAEVHAQLQRLLSRQFSITELFAHATVRSLAAHFESGAAAVPSGAGGANRLRAQRQREALSVRRLQHIDKK
jgi:acyl-CoA synthetase (AMP-forming)/AMP-acid ligase II/acyl carrier protein